MGTQRSGRRTCDELCGENDLEKRFEEDFGDAAFIDVAAFK